MHAYPIRCLFTFFQFVLQRPYIDGVVILEMCTRGTTIRPGNGDESEWYMKESKTSINGLG